MMIVDRQNNLDTLEIQVEVDERFFSDEIKSLETLSKKNCTCDSKSAIGLKL